MILHINPYDWQRVNPDLFFGRKELADEICDRLILKGHSFGIIGGRKIGKTTLLRYIEKELLKRSEEAIKGAFLILPVYIDMLTFPSRSEAIDIYQQIIFQIQKQLKHAAIEDFIPANSINSAEDFKDYLDRLITSIINYRIQFVFLFDEVEPIISSNWGLDFFRYWRSLLSNSSIQSFISTAFSGASEIDEIKRDVASPLANILAWIELKVFPISEVAELMRKPSQYNWPDTFIKNIYEVTGGHPFLVQYIMNYVCDHDVEEATNSLEEAKRRFLREQRVQFQNWWERFHDNTPRAIYAQLVENEKYNPQWLQKHFSSHKPEKWKKIVQDAKKTTDSSLDNNDILQYTYFADLFDLLLLGTEWGDLGDLFANLSPDRNKRRTRVEERKDHLVYVRNELAHSRPLTLGNLLKAQAFCIDLSDALQIVVDSKKQL